MNKLLNNSLLKAGRNLVISIHQTFPNTQTYIVGGCVRDLIMGNQPHDVDIATNVDIEKLIESYKTVDIGKSKDFGIVIVFFEGYEFEVAHFREEFGSNDNRHPAKVKQINDFAIDTSRRDFTINSLGIDVDGDIIDYHGGVKDIQNQIVKGIGIPSKRFEEDALRIIRAARFAAKYNFEIDSDTIIAMRQKRELVKNLSVERIRDEFMKVAVNGKALVKFLRILIAVGVLDIFLPEINQYRGFCHNPKFHPEGGLYEHTMSALNVSHSNNPLTNIAILFHDVGKMVTQTFEDGHVCYKGHAQKSFEMFMDIGKRFKFSNHQIESMGFAIQNHMIAHKFNEMKKSKIIQIRQNPNFNILKEVTRADDEARLHLFNENDFKNKMARIEEIFKTFGEQKEFESRIKSLINGNMVINIAQKIGIDIQGSQIGHIIHQVREVIIEKEFNITFQDTSRMVKKLIHQI